MGNGKNAGNFNNLANRRQRKETIMAGINQVLQTGVLSTAFNDLLCASHVHKVDDLSDGLSTRVHVHFKNGYAVSIVRGPYSIGWSQGLFEIAPINQDGDLDGRLFGDENHEDNVMGNLTVEKVLYYANKIANL